MPLSKGRSQGILKNGHLIIALFEEWEGEPIPEIVNVVLKSEVRFGGLHESIEGLVSLGTMIQRFRRTHDDSFRDKNGLTFDE